MQWHAAPTVFVGGERTGNEEWHIHVIWDVSQPSMVDVHNKMGSSMAVGMEVAPTSGEAWERAWK